MNQSGEVLKTKDRGLWTGPSQEHKELRLPRDCQPNNSTDGSSSSVEPLAGGDISQTSKLSVDAKEFYPKNYVHYPGQSAEAGDGSGDSNPVNNSSNDMTYEEKTVNHVTEVISHLTTNPDRFDALIKPLIDTLGMHLEDISIIEPVVSAIVEQSINESNFRYNGARLCNLLHGICQGVELTVFKNCLFRRCNEEHVKINHSNPKRLHGFVLFLAELYMQLEVLPGLIERYEPLGEALNENLTRLLCQPSGNYLENIKCACQVLKLAGASLDKQDPIKVELIFQHLQNISTSSLISEDIRSMIGSVFNLKITNWGEGNGSNYTPPASQIPYSLPQGNDPVFFGPDGKILTAEESQFLQVNAEASRILRNNRGYNPDECIDYSDNHNIFESDNEMESEVQAAFEKFLLMKKNTKENI